MVYIQYIEIFSLVPRIVHGLLVKFCKQHELAYYEQIISSTTYPSPFCLHRWLENEYVVKRAESTWYNFISLINYWKTLPKSKQLGTGDKSCLKLQESIKYSLIKNQLNWFPYIWKLSARAIKHVILLFHFWSLRLPSFTAIFWHYS